MKIYVDLVLFLNFFFDLVLLTGVDILLKRKIKIRRLLLGSIIGSLTIFFLFIKMNTITFFILKIFISILMTISTFGYKNREYFFKNITYLYLLSIILGGGLYLLNISFSYENKGLIFFHNGLGINIILIIVISPLIVTWYIKKSKSYHSSITNYFEVKIVLNNNEYNLNGYLDTGNRLKDPYFHRSIILVDKKELFNKNNKYIYVPYKALNSSGLIRCVKVDEIVINRQVFKNILIGESKDKINIDNINCLLPGKLKEELC